MYTKEKDFHFDLVSFSTGETVFEHYVLSFTVFDSLQSLINETPATDKFGLVEKVVDGINFAVSNETDEEVISLIADMTVNTIAETFPVLDNHDDKMFLKLKILSEVCPEFGLSKYYLELINEDDEDISPIEKLIVKSNMITEYAELQCYDPDLPKISILVNIYETTCDLWDSCENKGEFLYSNVNDECTSIEIAVAKEACSIENLHWHLSSVFEDIVHNNMPDSAGDLNKLVVGFVGAVLSRIIKLIPDLTPLSEDVPFPCPSVVHCYDERLFLIE